MPSLTGRIERHNDICLSLKCTRWPALEVVLSQGLKVSRGYPVIHLNAPFHPCVWGETSLHGYHPPESSDCQAEGSEQSSVSRKCKESRPLPVPAAKNRPRPMLFLR